MNMKHRIQKRIIFLGVVITLLFSGISVRLWWIQSVEASQILDKAKQQWERDKDIKPRRGSILDRNGQILAYEGKAYTVNATLKPRNEREAQIAGDNYVKDPYYTAEKLAPILHVSPEQLLKHLTRTDAFNVELGKEASKITEQQKNEIIALQYPRDAKGEPSEVNQLPGVTIWETTRRYYPHNNFASQVIGYVNYEEKAQMGIEQQFDKELRGEPGYLRMMKDGAGYQLPDEAETYKPAKDGMNLVLTIDQQIQEYAEQALDQAEAQYHPKRMMVLVSDPNTGEILAMANRPGFDPNTYWNIKNFTNDSISFMFEPGSTFKIITLAAAVEQNLFNPNDTYQSGLYTKVPGKPIQDHNNGVGWGRITFLEGVQRSSNVAFVILGYEKLKTDLLSAYFEKFGIGRKTGIDLPGEEDGIMRDLKKSRPRDVAVTTFGQGVAVTPIQQVAAVGAIANGGKLLKPQIVKEIRDPHTNGVVKTYGTEVVRQVVSSETAKKVRDYLETVITGDHGTGKAFGEGLEGYHVAGKTGTAQTYDPQTGKIVEGKYIYSFIGFAPKDNPRLVVYVVVDDPQTEYSSNEVGSKIVAPIFRTVMGNSLQYLNEQPDMSVLEPKKAAVPAAPVYEKAMPNLVGMTTTAAENRAKQEGLDYTVIGTGTKIADQYPKANEKVTQPGKVYLVTNRTQGTKMPDFTGKSLREVMEFASLLQLQVNAIGTGFVSEQSIKPGTPLTGKERLQVTLQSLDAPTPTAATDESAAESPADATEEADEGESP
ncbi:penicillin-binding protein 2B [Brevibacillus fulvus]|uniref:Penicillin-binding protein 2B n=2 Tax=Brevibacillus fulvus TaxID=1125967 RepID=A0A938XWQ9_9BACL|nr:penicillin-binding protein 2B [Brevibacillus fulvus]